MNAILVVRTFLSENCYPLFLTLVLFSMRNYTLELYQSKDWDIWTF